MLNVNTLSTTAISLMSDSMYYGNESAYQTTKNFLMHWGEKGTKTAILLTGRPGIGKTYLTETLGNDLSLPVITINASASRLKKDINSIISATSLKDRTLIVLDECEGMKTADLSTIIKNTGNPVILCCNFLEKVDYSVRKLCNVVHIKSPPWFTYRDYIIDRYTELYGGSDLSDMIPLIEDISKQIKSFRHANHVIEDMITLGITHILDDIGTEEDITDIEEIGLSLRGQPPDRFSMQPDTLIHWMNDNADDPDTISKTDIFNERAYILGYKFWRYSYALLGAIRSNKTVKFPRTFGMMSHAKHAHKEKEAPQTQPKTEPTKIILSSTTELEQLLKEIEEEDKC